MDTLNIVLKVCDENGQEVMNLDADGPPSVVLAIIKAAEEYVKGKMPATVAAYDPR